MIVDWAHFESQNNCNGEGERKKMETVNTQWKKYHRYQLEVDPKQDDRAREIRLCDFSRPHMRAFHCTWWCFFVAFFNWFAITPLLSDIRRDLGLSKFEIWTSSIISVGGTVLIRIVLGPLCDKFGARILFSIVLCATAIPTACTGLIQSAEDLYILRLFVGLAGGTFVMCQYWSSVMFADEIIGTTNALVAGWGNLGAGITQLIMGSGLYPLFKVFCGGNNERAWRSVCIVPALIAFVSGVVVCYISDDCPKGNYRELKNHSVMSKVSSSKAFKRAFYDWNTWILFLQYACSFGVELTMNNAATLYFMDEYELSLEAGSAIASIFGWMNLFARGLGGFVSDFANFGYGMQGRLLLNFFLLAMEGILVLAFASTNTLAASVVTLVFFSLFVQAAEGAAFAIVPFVNPSVTGAVTGIVGAGGNVGAVCFGLAFRGLDYLSAFRIMGFTILGSSFLTILMNIKGHTRFCCGEPLQKDIELDSAESSDFAEMDGVLAAQAMP